MGWEQSRKYSIKCHFGQLNNFSQFLHILFQNKMWFLVVKNAPNSSISMDIRINRYLIRTRFQSFLLTQVRCSKWKSASILWRLSNDRCSWSSTTFSWALIATQLCWRFPIWLNSHPVLIIKPSAALTLDP